MRVFSLPGSILVAGLCACGQPSPHPQQVAVGFNGPASQRTDVFRSAQDLRSSWVGRALSKDQLDNVIGATDFSQNVLVGFSFGKRENASGRIDISELSYDSRMPGYFIAIRIGVAPESCGIAFRDSYPFVLGSTAIATPEAELTGYFTQNFGDGCDRIVESGPTPVSD